MGAHARHLWTRETEQIPRDPTHPARRWLSARQLWRPELPLPGAVRWLPAERHYQGKGKHTGAGSLVALATPPASWAAAWPNLPAPQAIQIVAIDETGAPALDRPAESGGLGKRSVGATTGAILILGCPNLTETLYPVRVVEGMADALALASRFAGTAVSTLGTATMGDAALQNWLATATEGVVIHADQDPAGEAAARELRRNIRNNGGKSQAILPRSSKDPAEAAATSPFGALPNGWEDYARKLRETTDWPRWEIARQAVNLLSEEAH